jgi:molybdate transport system substrate-binding protein
MHKNVRTVSLSIRRVVIALVLITALAIPSNAFASEIKVLCTSALTGAMEKLGPQFERETGNKLVLSYGATGGLLNRVKNGEAADVVIVTAPALDSVVKLGKIVWCWDRDSSRCATTGHQLGRGPQANSACR